jgi:two-component system, NarL family, sensor kinase
MTMPMLRVFPCPLYMRRSWTQPFINQRWLLLLVTGLLFCANLAFIWRQAVRPADGVRLEPGAAAWQTTGVVVTQLRSQTSGLQTGDLVIAVAGRRLERWAQALFDPNAVRPEFEVGETVRYTVLRNGHPTMVVVTLARYPFGVVIAKNWSILLFALSAQLITLFILWRRREDPAAQALFVWAWNMACATTWLFGLSVPDLVDGLGFWLFSATATGAWFLSWGANLHFALVFPQPHLLIVQRPWLIRVIYGAPFVLYAVYLAITWLLADTMVAWLSWWRLSDWSVAFIYLLLAIWVVIQQYRSSHGETRLQIRWLAFAALLSVGGSLLLWFLPGVLLGRPLIQSTALGLIVLSYPLALTFALLRYRLFDIDIIMRRTFIYGVLSVLLALVYWASVLLFQRLFGLFTTQQQNQLVTVLSTVTIAVIVRPLQRRVQATIDRRFYRRAYTIEQVLVTFGAIARTETNLEQLNNRLMLIVSEAMHPTTVSVWLRPQTGNGKHSAPCAQSFPAITVHTPPADVGRPDPRTVRRKGVDRDQR